MDISSSRGRSALRSARAASGGLTCLVTVRCCQRQSLLSPPVRRNCIESLLWLQRNRGVLVHAFVVMSSHVHLVLTLPAEQLSRAMHSFKSFTANEINKALGRVGPLWDEGYHEEALLNDEAVVAATAYVENNPVKARIVKTPDGYEWSSAWPDYRLVVDRWR